MPCSSEGQAVFISSSIIRSPKAILIFCRAISRLRGMADVEQVSEYSRDYPQHLDGKRPGDSNGDSETEVFENMVGLGFPYFSHFQRAQPSTRMHEDWPIIP